MSFDVLDCADCGATTLRRGPTQKYCIPCSNERHRQTQANWAKANPVDPEKARAAGKRQQSKIVEIGHELSVQNRASMAWQPEEPVDLSTLVRVSMPFDYAASKNAVWRVGRGGHVYARAEANAFRADLTARIRASDAEWFQGKVWIDIYVEKPNQRGDAINVVDLVCDAVKDAIGIDDRWFCIRRLDWSIVKDSPRLMVGVGQNIAEDHQACSHCGSIRPLRPEHFGSNKSLPSGFARVCRDCSSPVKTRKAREQAA